jgi:hypothetical protein
MFVWLISYQPAVFSSRNKSAINNQPAVLFSQNKPALAISHQPNEQANITRAGVVQASYGLVQAWYRLQNINTNNIIYNLWKVTLHSVEL